MPGDRVLTVGHKRGWVVSTTFSKTLSTQVLTVVVLRVFSAKQLVLRCRLCPQETGVWKYSLLQHFEQFHEGCDLLQEEVLGDDERDHIINNC